MEITDVLKKPFSDITSLLLGSLMGVIPIVSLALVGFGFENYKRPKELPAIDFVKQWVLGLKMSFVGLVYAIIPILMLWRGATQLNGLLLLLGTVLFVGIALPTTKAMIKVGETDSINSGFQIDDIFKSAYSSDFVKVWIVAVALVLAVSFILGFIPFIGWFFDNFISTVIFWTYLGSKTA